MFKRKQSQVSRDGEGYAKKSNKKFNIFAFILCVLIAFIIWLYASNLEKNSQAETNVSTNTQAAITVALPQTL